MEIKATFKHLKNQFLSRQNNSYTLFFPFAQKPLTSKNLTLKCKGNEQEKGEKEMLKLKQEYSQRERDSSLLSSQTEVGAPQKSQSQMEHSLKNMHWKLKVG